MNPSDAKLLATMKGLVLLLWAIAAASWLWVFWTP